MSEFSIYVPVGEQAAGKTVYVGQLTIEGDCGIVVNGKSDSVHKNNILFIGDIGLEGPENGPTSSWTIDWVPAGVYDVTYFVGERGLGEQPAGASFDFVVTEPVCEIETTTTTAVVETTTTTNLVTTTTEQVTTTSSVPGTTTTVPETTTSTDGSTTTSSSLVITTTVPPPVTTPETLPDTGLVVGLYGWALLGAALFALGVSILKSRRMIDDV
jgi:hypothetical protein